MDDNAPGDVVGSAGSFLPFVGIDAPLLLPNAIQLHPCESLPQSANTAEHLLDLLIFPETQGKKEKEKAHSCLPLLLRMQPQSIR